MGNTIEFLGKTGIGRYERKGEYQQGVLGGN
jgi:hypothetical protein